MNRSELGCRRFAATFSVGPAGKAMTFEQQSESLWVGVGRLVRRAAALAVAGAIFLLGFRLLSLCTLGIIVLLFAFVPRWRRKRLVLLGAIVVVIPMLLPFDTAAGPWHYGMREGRSSGGPHFVRFTVGFGADTAAVRRYGECIHSGCSSISIVPPRWILVWN